MPKGKGGGGGAKINGKQVLAAATHLTALIGRGVEVPNGLWEGFDDGGYTKGVVKKAGRIGGVDTLQVTFVAQDGWKTPATWIKYAAVVGEERVEGTRHYCRLGEPPAPASKAKPSAPPRPAANRKRKAKA